MAGKLFVEHHHVWTYSNAGHYYSIILETDSNAIVSRVSKPRLDMVDIPFSEQTLLQAYQTARERFTSQLLR